jgi:hypothetical protein
LLKILIDPFLSDDPPRDTGWSDYLTARTRHREVTYEGDRLGEFGATLENVVEEVLYVTNMEKAFAAAGPVRKEAYGVRNSASGEHDWSRLGLRFQRN